MDAVKFVHERLRMCNSYTHRDSEDIVCSPDCEIHKLMKRARRNSCEEAIYNHTQEVVEIVERWSIDHPVKTRQSKFLELYPFAAMSPDKNHTDANVLVVCPKMIDFRCTCIAGKDCPTCRFTYWSTEEPE